MNRTSESRDSFLKSEVSGFLELEKKIDLLLEKYNSLKQERAELREKISLLEDKLAAGEAEIADLKSKLEEGMNPEKERLIREKVNGLLEKLENL